jgi:hypothetical protein
MMMYDNDHRTCKSTQSTIFDESLGENRIKYPTFADDVPSSPSLDTVGCIHGNDGIGRNE